MDYTINRIELCGNTGYFDTPGANVPYYRLDRDHVVLLDGGNPGADTAAILSALDQEHLRVAGMIVTHAHPDHMGLCQSLQAGGTKVAMPAFEASCVASPENLKAWYPLFHMGQVENYFPFMFLQADVLLPRGGGKITFCGAEFEIIPTPGHTPEHIAVRTPDDVVYLADALMGMEECRRAKLPYAFSIALDRRTKQRLGALTAKKFLLAHSGTIDALDALIAENERAFDACLDKVEAALAGEQTLDGWLAAVTERFGFHRRAEDVRGMRLIERNTRIFVDNLLETGRVTMRAEGGRIFYRKADL